MMEEGIKVEVLVDLFIRQVIKLIKGVRDKNESVGGF